MISVTNRPKAASVPVYQSKTGSAQTEKNRSAHAPAQAEDEITLSQAARAAMAKQAAEPVEGPEGVPEEKPQLPEAMPFPSFSVAFSKVTEGYSNQIRDYYAKEHGENLNHEDPYVHIWNKYKNPESPDFRGCMSEDERAWAYDHELNLLSGGRNLQISNPYVFPEGAPTLASAAAEANRACREELNLALQDILAKNEIELPEGAALSLTVDETYTIHVEGLEDEELTAALEKALNQGENGRNLYSHLKVSVPGDDSLSIDYKDGRLAPLEDGREWDAEALREVKKQAGPVWTRYSPVYDPCQGPMTDQILSLNPETVHYTQEQMDRFCSAVRMGVRQAVEEYRLQRTTLKDIPFSSDPEEEGPGVPETPEAPGTSKPSEPETPESSRPVVPAGSVLAARTAAVPAAANHADEDDLIYVFGEEETAESKPAETEEESAISHVLREEAKLIDAKRAIVEAYYAKQNAENRRFPNPMVHIADKYINYDSPYFRSDMTEMERKISYEQEQTYLYGGRLGLYHYDIALMNDGGAPACTMEIEVSNTVRSQAQQWISDKLREAGITLPEGSSFTLNVNPYDYKISVLGLQYEELTKALEDALNAGKAGKNLYAHIEFCNPAVLPVPAFHVEGMPVYSQYSNANVWKRSLFLTVEKWTGYDIRTLERRDGTFWTPDGKDLWNVLSAADIPDKYETLKAHSAIYRQLARDGWDNTPDAVRSLTWKDGKLYQPDELQGARTESDWQAQVIQMEDERWAAHLAQRQVTLRKEAAERAAGLVSRNHFGYRHNREFSDAELMRHRPV